MCQVTLLRAALRRVAFSAALTFGAATLLLHSFIRAGMAPVDALGWCASAAGALISAMVLVVALATAVPRLAPLRVLAEVSALAAAVVGLLALVGLLPAPDFSVAAFVPVAALTWALLHGGYIELLPRRDHAEYGLTHLPIPPERLWRSALPTRAAGHWDPLLLRSFQDAEDADTFHLEYARRDGVDAVTITLLDITPEREFRYLFQGGSAGSAFMQGTITLRLTPDGIGGTWLELSRSIEDRTFGDRLRAMLDRAGKDEVDFLRASALGEPFCRTLAGAHRLAVLGRPAASGETGATQPA